MRAIQVATLAIVLLVSTLAPLAVAAQGPGGDSRSDELELTDEMEAQENVSDDEDDAFEDAPRSLEVDEEDDAFEIRSFGAQGDRIRVRFEARDGDLRLDFVVPESGATEIQLEVAFEAVLEFVDGNGDGRFDLGEQVVQRFDVDDMPFNVPILEGLDEGHRIEVSYVSSFTLRLVFYVFPTETMVNGTLVKPTQVKFDIGIDGFPLMQEDTFLAVETKLKTEVEPAFGTSPTVEELEAIGERYKGFFRWSSTADVDGITSPVNSTLVKVETELESNATTELEVERTIVLVYPQGEQVLHDPIVGVAIVPALGSILTLINPLVYAVMIGVAVLFVVGTILLRRRRAS